MYPAETKEDAMLKKYFVSAQTLARINQGPTEPFIDDFANSLCESGYAASTGREYLWATAHLGIWMRVRGLTIGALDEKTIEEFADHLSVCSCFQRPHSYKRRAVHGAQKFLAYLRDRSVVAVKMPAGISRPEIINRFEHWMRCHRGVTESTLSVYRRILLEMLEKLGAPAHYTAESLRKFLSERAGRHGRSRAKSVVTALRAFLRYLVAQGLCIASLVDAIPTFAEWKLSSLPRYLSYDDVERIVDAPDLATALGRRDRAILLLLARLGLRAGDVVGLRLDDIDWQEGSILLGGKGRRASKLPLPQEVGDAILAYLADGRPSVDCEHVFLRARAPNGMLKTSSAVSYIVESAAKRAKVEMPHGRAHALRHSMATNLVRSGVPLPAVGVILRHRSQETTAHYAKVDVPALRKVAQPWPLGEVTSC
jgi:site-specific recombinase XerD